MGVWSTKSSLRLVVVFDVWARKHRHPGPNPHHTVELGARSTKDPEVSKTVTDLFANRNCWCFQCHGKRLARATFCRVDEPATLISVVLREGENGERPITNHAACAGPQKSTIHCHQQNKSKSKLEIPFTYANLDFRSEEAWCARRLTDSTPPHSRRKF